MVRTEDEKELARKFDNEHVDTKSATAMFDLMRRKLSHSAAYPHLLSLLQHMLLLPCKYTHGIVDDELSPYFLHICNKFKQRLLTFLMIWCRFF